MVSPAATSGWTEFEVKDVDGTVQIAARKGDLTISDDSGTSTLPQGQQTTRDESDSHKNRTKPAAGTAPAAVGGLLNHPVAIARCCFTPMPISRESVVN
jgi:ferric-dicitrate binding protein FerR (iron transport regulator)